MGPLLIIGQLKIDFDISRQVLKTIDRPFLGPQYFLSTNPFSWASEAADFFNKPGFVTSPSVFIKWR